MFGLVFFFFLLAMVLIFGWILIVVAMEVGFGCGGEAGNYWSILICIRSFSFSVYDGVSQRVEGGNGA